jgi:hypothetical protein
MCISPVFSVPRQLRQFCRVCFNRQGGPGKAIKEPVGTAKKQRHGQVCTAFRFDRAGWKSWGGGLARALRFGDKSTVAGRRVICKPDILTQSGMKIRAIKRQGQCALPDLVCFAMLKVV